MFIVFMFGDFRRLQTVLFEILIMCFLMALVAMSQMHLLALSRCLYPRRLQVQSEL